MLLLKLEYKNKVYYIETENNIIKYYRLNGKRKDYSLSVKELKMIKYSIESIIPSSKHIYITEYLYHGQKHKLSIDPKTQFYFLDHLSNKKDFLELNILFNNQDEFLAQKNKTIIDNQDKSNESFIKRTILFGKVVVVVTIMSSLLVACNIRANIKPESNYNAYLSSLQQENEKSYADYLFETSKTMELSDDDLIKSIYDAIDNNPNLSNDEKELLHLYISKDLLLDNKNYLNTSLIIKRLKTLRIRYGYNFDEIYRNFTAGYFFKSNEIRFKAPNLKLVNLTHFSHEIYHLLDMGYSSSNIYLQETINTIFNHEYNHVIEYDSINTEYLDYTYALMEIIGPEPFKNYKFFSFPGLISNELAKLYSQEENADKLLYTLEAYRRLYSQKPLNDDEMTNLNALHQQIVDQISNYYYSKTGSSYHDDLIMLFYLDKVEFIEKLKTTFGLNESDTIYNMQPPRYICNPNGTLVIYLDERIIIINDSNRYLNKSKII